jgi:3-hydroxybutyryl-CoA dehydrogenase
MLATQQDSLLYLAFMRIIIAGKQPGWLELAEASGIPWLLRDETMVIHTGDILLDLRDEAWDMEWYERAGNNPVFISATAGTLDQHHAPWNIVRMNSWLDPDNDSIECCGQAQVRASAEAFMKTLGKKIEWVPDIAGMVSGRVIAMIINEAWMAFEENVSSREDIDEAMKLGTNYPYGPFEWCEKIGAGRVAGLLQTLAQQHAHYQPSPMLLKYASVQKKDI